MPLVSGVCRKASAPMLSHGGSRLNASKPEANPKTSCPTTTQLTKKNRTRACVAFFSQNNPRWFLDRGASLASKKHFFFTPRLRKEPYFFEIESPLKRTLPSGGSRREVCPKFTRISHLFWSPKSKRENSCKG
jgi:hypothetical protein